MSLSFTDNSLFLVASDEILDAPVIGFFYFRAKIAGGKLMHLTVILNTFATYSLARAGMIGTVTFLDICGLMTFRH